MSASVIAGTAAISAVGSTVQESFDRLVAGDSGVGPLTAFPAERFGVRHAYQVDRQARTDRERGLASRLLTTVIEQAAAEAGIDSLADVPVIIGTGLGETRTVESAWLDGQALDPGTDSLVAAVREATGAREVQVFSNACSASLYALAAASDLIASGSVDTVVVAGVDVLSQSMFGLLDRVHPDPPTSVRPFDIDRQGVIMGDGACAVALRRDEEAATSSRVRLRAVSLGCDAFHATAPDEDGIEHTIRAAHRAAGTDPADLDAVYAHGTGTVRNDEAEATALGRVVPAEVPVTSVKGATGHTSGGSGLFSVCLAVETFRTGRLPGTAGLERTDPAAVGLALSPTARELGPVELIQVDAFGFGGLNAVAILEHANGTTRRPAPAGVRPRTAQPATTRPALATLHGPDGTMSVRAVGLCFPDDGIHDLPDLASPSAEEVDLRATIGRKGYRTMTPATRVAVAAAQRAVAGHWAARSREDDGEFFGGSRGVVVASAHGTTESVCTTAELIDSEGVGATSPLELPNASRNVMAAILAIRHGVTGVCLTMDAADDGGWDALRWASRLITSGRCEEVLYVSAEAPSAAATALTGHEHAHGAVALLLGPGPTSSSSAGDLAASGAAEGHESLTVPVGGHLATLAPGLRVVQAVAAGRATLLDGGWRVSTP